MESATTVAMPGIDEPGLSARDVTERQADGRGNEKKISSYRSVKDIIRANVFALVNGLNLGPMMLAL